MQADIAHTRTAPLLNLRLSACPTTVIKTENPDAVRISNLPNLVIDHREALGDRNQLLDLDFVHFPLLFLEEM